MEVTCGDEDLRRGAVRSRELAKTANQVVRWQTAVLRSIETALGQADVEAERLEGIRGTMAALADSRRPPADHDSRAWLLEQSKPFRDRYRLGDLTSVRAAVWVRAGRGLLGPYKELNDFLAAYIIGTDLAAERSGAARSLVAIHSGGAGRVAAADGRLTWDEELAFARWVGDYWGVLPLVPDPKIPTWLRLLNSLPDLSEETLEAMAELRRDRGWGDRP